MAHFLGTRELANKSQSYSENWGLSSLPNDGKIIINIPMGIGLIIASFSIHTVFSQELASAGLKQCFHSRGKRKPTVLTFNRFLRLYHSALSQSKKQ